MWWSARATRNEIGSPRPASGRGAGGEGFQTQQFAPPFTVFSERSAPSSPALLPRKAGGEGSQSGSFESRLRAPVDVQYPSESTDSKNQFSRAGGCIDRGELRSALTRVGGNTSSPNPLRVGHSHRSSERNSLTRVGLSNLSAERKLPTRIGRRNTVALRPTVLSRKAAPIVWLPSPRFGERGRG